MKSIFKSKTFWLAILQGLVGVWAVVFSAFPTLGWVAIAKTVLDIALRYVTSLPIQ